MGAPYNFEANGRLPIRPLSYDNKELAVAKEILIDYKNGTAYVCDENKNIVDIGANPSTIAHICEYLKENPELITKNITVLLNGEETDLETALIKHENALTDILKDINDVKESIPTVDPNLENEGQAADAKAVKDALDNLAKELEKYLKLTGGTLTGRLGISLDTPIYATDGEDTVTMIYASPDGTVHIGDSNTKRISLNGPIILDPDNYGTDIPSSGVEGQLFFKLIKE